MNKTVYAYDENGMYTGEAEAELSPREKHVWLMPPNATDVVPPSAGKNECTVWENGMWTIKPDYRGTVYWLPDGSRHEISAIGEIVPDEALDEPAPPSLEEAKTLKLAELHAVFSAESDNAHCLSSAGFEINADDVANRNIEGLVFVLTDGESTLFRAYDNRFYDVTREQLETMRKEIVFNSQRLYQRKWQLEAAIEAAKTPDELKAVDISFRTGQAFPGGEDVQTA